MYQGIQFPGHFETFALAHPKNPFRQQPLLYMGCTVSPRYGLVQSVQCRRRVIAFDVFDFLIERFLGISDMTVL
jgi:hypothetical protein